jgi:hypothetical protein
VGFPATPSFSTTYMSRLVNDYVAVWNESDADERRRRIRSVWSADGNTCHRLLDASGYEAIETRVIGSWERWLRDGSYILQPRQTVFQQDALKIDFVMVAVADGKVEANGLSFLVLDSDGRVKHDYQFNPGIHEPNPIEDRYLSIWQEPNPEIRRSAIAELWAEDGMLISDNSVAIGRSAIETVIAQSHRINSDRGQVLLSAHATHAHHHVLKFKWRTLRSHDRAECERRSDLIILTQERGQILFDFQFTEPPGVP